MKDTFADAFPKVDFATLIFVLSAISPENHFQCLEKIFSQMEHDSYFYFRDYARYDLAQVRLAKRTDSKLKDDFYLKTDGTRVYYFSEEYLRSLLEQAGFEILELGNHYRVIKNKKEGLEMNRVWIQGICRKNSSN